MQILPKDLGIGLHNGTCVFEMLQDEYKNFSVPSLADAVWRLLQSKSQPDPDFSAFFHQSGIRKDLGPRKAGLTEFMKTGKKTPLAIPRSPTVVVGGTTTRKVIPTSPTSFAEAARVAIPVTAVKNNAKL